MAQRDSVRKDKTGASSASPPTGRTPPTPGAGTGVARYRDLLVWQKAFDLVSEVYRATARFPAREQYGLTAQTRRACVSVVANIAEGAARQHTREFVQHLHVALGSMAELETYLLLSERLRYLPEEASKALMASASEVGRMLRGLVKSLQRKGETSTQ